MNGPGIGLDTLLDLDGSILEQESGYWMKIEVRRVPMSRHAPHGIRYSLTLHDEKRVLIHAGLGQAARRDAIAHETGHIMRGPASTCERLREEALVDRQAARLLMPSATHIGHAFAWSRGDHEAAAADLWVSERLLHVRLSTLAPRDREHLDEQLATILI